ncbi:MAG: hypothetical protein LUH10_15450 [Tannerellaceae bacterium]|nr:hypothetical protein [Tannerellaceae bacterium]
MNTIETKLDQIIRTMVKDIPLRKEDFPIGLYNGEAGILLFLLYYTKYRPVPEVIHTAECLIDNLLEKIEDRIHFHSYCSGLSSVLYLFEHLKENNILDIDLSDTQILLEDYLLRCLNGKSY